MRFAQSGFKGKPKVAPSGQLPRRRELLLIFLDSSWYASMFKQLSELGGCGAAVSWKARNFAAGTCSNRSASANINSSVWPSWSSTSAGL